MAAQRTELGARGRSVCTQPLLGSAFSAKWTVTPSPKPLSVEYSLVENDDWDSRVTLDKALTSLQTLPFLSDENDRSFFQVVEDFEVLGGASASFIPTLAISGSPDHPVLLTAPENSTFHA